jgi:hypothetical protein
MPVVYCCESDRVDEGCWVEWEFGKGEGSEGHKVSDDNKVVAIRFEGETANSRPIVEVGRLSETSFEFFLIQLLSKL